MKKSIFLSALFVALMALPISTFAQRFYVSIPVIPIRHGGISLNVSIGCPGPDYVWVNGYWDWDDYYRDYVWVDGTWALPPRHGWVWTDGYWENGPNGYLWISGYWSNPYRPYSYFAATHRNGGGYAPYYIRHAGDRGHYSCVYVSGNRRYDSNYYYSGRYNDSDRRNYVGSYERARKETRNSSYYSSGNNRGNDRNSYRQDRNDNRGGNGYGESRRDNRVDNGTTGSNNGGNRTGNYGGTRQMTAPSSSDGMRQQRRESVENQSNQRTSYQNAPDTRGAGVSDNSQRRNENSGWRTVSDQPANRPMPSRSSQGGESRNQSTQMQSRSGNDGQWSRSSSSSESRGRSSSRSEVRSERSEGRR